LKRRRIKESASKVFGGCLKISRDKKRPNPAFQKAEFRFFSLLICFFAVRWICERGLDILFL